MKGGMLTGAAAWALDAHAVCPNVDLSTDVVAGTWTLEMFGSKARPDELVYPDQVRLRESVRISALSLRTIIDEQSSSPVDIISCETTRLRLSSRRLLNVGSMAARRTPMLNGSKERRSRNG